MPSSTRKDKYGPNGDAPTTRVANQALQFIRLCVRWEQSQRRSTVLRSLNIYPPSSSRNGQWLVIAKGWAEGYRVVAFHRSPDILNALLGILQKIADESIVWQADKYDAENTE